MDGPVDERRFLGCLRQWPQGASDRRFVAPTTSPGHPPLIVIVSDVVAARVMAEASRSIRMRTVEPGFSELVKVAMPYLLVRTVPIFAVTW